MSNTVDASADPREFSFKDFFSKLNGGLEFQSNESIFKQTAYNVIGCFLMFSGCVVTYGAFMVLNPFLKPLLWALLCGSVLYPFKVRISNLLNLIIDSLNKPSIIHVLADGISYPFLLYNEVSEFIHSLVYRNWLPVLIITFVPWIHFTLPQFSFELIKRLYDIIVRSSSLILALGSNSFVVIPLIIIFIWMVFFKWDHVDKELLVGMSVVTWLAAICYITSFMNIFHVPAFFGFLVLFVLSYGCNKSSSRKSDDSFKSDPSSSANLSTPPDVSLSSVEKKSFIFDSSAETTVLRESLSRRRKFKSQLSFVAYKTSHGDEEIEQHIGDQYLYWVGFACIFIFFLKCWWTPYIIGLHMIIFCGRKLCNVVRFHIFKSFSSVAKILVPIFAGERFAVLFPPPIRNIYEIIVLTKARGLTILKESSDALASSLVMLSVILFIIFASVFVTMQVYAEGMYMVKVGSKVLNESLIFNNNMTVVPESWQDHLDSAFENAYVYGRDYISKTIRKLLEGISEEKIVDLERMLLELYDRVYQTWISSNNDNIVGPKVTQDAVYQIWDSFTLHASKTSGLLNTRTIMQFINNNMTTFSSAVKNVWDFTMDNVGLIFYLLETLVSIVLVSGTTVFGLIIDLIIFMTALFYLLTSSRDMYKPVEFITKVSPNYGNKLAVAIERSVTEVFMVSGKLSLFYGLYTWFLHTLFQMPIIYLPTFAAAIFASVPLLPTYVVCVPGVLDLWLLKELPVSAFFLFVLQFAPTYFVDVAIYEDIHGGHPYLTGLAMAGGVLYFGIEGAIIGPLVLCLLLVIMNFFASLMQEHYESATNSSEL